MKNPVSVHLYGVLLFLSSYANELRTGMGEKNQQRRKPQGCVVGIVDGRAQSNRGTVGEQTALQGERTIGRLNLMEKVTVQVVAAIRDTTPKQRSDR